MSTFDQENEKLFNTVNQNATRQREMAYTRSKCEERVKTRKEKMESKIKKIKQAIATILAIATITSTIALTHNITTGIIEDNNAVISIQEANDIIDNKINEYSKLMNMHSSSEDKIEVMVGRNFETPYYEETVYYKPENLAKHITEAAKISESEVRCVIIAAYNIINEPYINNTIGSALSLASGMQDENTSYQIPSTSQEFLEQQGYESWNDYKMEERSNIKKLYATEKYVQGENRKVM